MWVKEDFFKRGSFIVGDGLGTRFWENVWLDNSSLANQYQIYITLSEQKMSKWLLC
jgi:hypothetical protein